MTTHTERFVPALIGLSIVLSIAGFFRFFDLSELLIFSTDQGRALLAGRNILLGEFILEGPKTSVDSIHLGPLYYYMTAIALWFSRFHPIGPTIMVAAIGVLTSGFLYLYMWRNWEEKRLAILAGVAYALSPLVVWQSRIALEPSPLPLIVILWLWSITEAMRQRSKGWWIVATFWPFIGMQLNFSAVVLWVAQALMLLLHTPRISSTAKSILVSLGGACATGLLIGKYLWSTPTPWEYWQREWLLWTFPGIPLAATLLALLAGAILLYWLFISTRRQYRRLPQPILSTVLLSWIGVAGLAFLIKTVGGDHALALLFLAPAILLAVAFQPVLKERYFLATLMGSILLFLLWAMHGFQFLTHLEQLTLKDHTPVIAAIAQASDGQPYNFVYRGHLDVYDAADDHYQYLLWYAGIPPQHSARIALQEPYFEKWLWPEVRATVPVARTLYLYYPAEAIQRYERQGTLLPGNGFLLDVVQ